LLKISAKRVAALSTEEIEPGKTKDAFLAMIMTIN
jgi:hypothetical protein